MTTFTKGHDGSEVFLELSVTVHPHFSIDGQILPKIEVPYHYVSGYIRDMHFRQLVEQSETEVLLKIVLMPNHEYVEEFLTKSQPQDALIIIGILHSALADNCNALEKLINRPIVVLTKALLKYSCYPCLRFNGELKKWWWDISSTNLSPGSVYIAKIE